MLKIIMTKGLPASGKSAWAKEMCAHGYKRVNKDDLRAMIDNGHWSDKNENFVMEMRDFLVRNAIKQGHSIIVDDTNFHPIHEERLKQIAKDTGAEFEVKDFTDVPLEVCIARDAQRTNPVGRKVILSMYSKYLKQDTLPLKQDETLPKAIICDLDGTLCLHNGRSPYDADKCDTDLVNEPVRYILKRAKAGTDIVFVSGREDKYREKTEKWLNKHGFKKFKLFMRTTGDMRNDAIVKLELFNTHVRPYWCVRFVLDDRDRVVDMWRTLGLTCLQVNYGAF